MVNISKNIVDEFVKSVNQTSFKTAYYTINYYIEQAMSNIMAKNPLINSYAVYVANEVFTGTEFSSSSLDIFLEINAIQLELNFKEKKQYVFKSGLATFFNTFKSNFKLFSRKNPSQKVREKRIKKEEQKLEQKQNYDVVCFFKDLQIQIAKQSYKTTKIGIHPNHISIVGKDEYGLDINIFPVFVSGNDYSVLYNIKNKKETLVDFKYRWNNLEEINSKTKNLFKLQVRIFNNIFWNVFKASPNQIFIESLLFNVPLEYYTYNIYETTSGIINYLRNSTMKSFVSICDKDKKLFDEPLNTVTLDFAFKFIKSLKI